MSDITNPSSIKEEKLWPIINHIIKKYNKSPGARAL